SYPLSLHDALPIYQRLLEPDPRRIDRGVDPGGRRLPHDAEELRRRSHRRRREVTGSPNVSTPPTPFGPSDMVGPSATTPHSPVPERTPRMPQTPTGPVSVGLIGAGTISAEYLMYLTSFPDVQVHIVGDLFPEAAAARAAEFYNPASGTAEDVLSRPDVEIVVNLTIPTAHAEVSRAIVAAGKHVWTEKPITTAPADAQALLAAADEA